MGNCFRVKCMHAKGVIPVPVGDDAIPGQWETAILNRLGKGFSVGGRIPGINHDGTLGS